MCLSRKAEDIESSLARDGWMESEKLATLGHQS